MTDTQITSVVNTPSDQIVNRVNNNTLTGDNTFTGQVTVETIQFNTTALPAHSEGQLHWDDTDKTLEIDTEITGTHIQLGQETVLRATNKTGSDIPNGSVVYINGAQGNRPTIALADADTEATSSKTIGITTNTIANNSTGYVTCHGIVREIDTSAFSEGDLIWLSSTAGGYTATRPDAPKHAVFLGVVLTVNATEGVIFIRPQNGFEIGELHDVLLGAGENGQIFIKDETSGYWKNTSNILIDDSNTTIYSDSNGGTAKDLTIACGTDKTIVLSETVYQDMQFPISSGKVPAANFPSFEAFTTNTNGYAFSVDDYIDLACDEVPHAWKIGTNGSFHIHFALKSDQSTGSDRFAQFSVYVAYADVNEVWTETTITAEATIPTGTVALKHLFLTLGSLTLTNNVIGTQIKVRVKRIAATGGTEYADDVFITQVGCHFECDTFGSRSVSSK